MPNWKKVITSGSNAVLNHITASGNISASGIIISDKYEFGHGGTAAYLQATDIASLTAKFANNKFNGHITASGNISASGNIIAPTFVGNVDAVNGDFDGTLEADAITIGGADIITEGIIRSLGTIGSAIDFNSQNMTNVDIDSGTIDGCDITVGEGKTLELRNAGAVNISNDLAQSIVSNADGAAIDNCIIGATTATRGTFTNLTATGNSVLGNAIGDTHTFTGHITASGNISASLSSTSSFGRVKATTVEATNFYGYQLSSHPSNLTVGFNNTYYYAPLTGQSTAEHASSNSNERIPMTNPFNGHPVKTTIRSTKNDATKNANFTCSIHFEPPYNNNDFTDNAPGTVAPGAASTGHILFKEIHATGPNENHAAVHFDWLQNAYSSSANTDIPSGSRITLSIKSDYASSQTYIINTMFAWDYSDIY